MLDWQLENVSTYGSSMDSLIDTIFYVTGVWLVIAEIVLIAFVILYRRRPERKSAWIPGSNLKQLSFVLLPCALILALDLGIDAAGAPVWHEIKESLPEADLTVRVVGKQFAWDFVHPGVDGELDTDDDIETEFDLYVPANRVVRFELQSQDVLHSFWLPNLRLKQDVVPGRSIQGWFEVTKAGTYPIACAELCGLGHGKMKAQLNVQTPEEHEEWVLSQQPADDFFDF